MSSSSEQDDAPPRQAKRKRAAARGDDFEAKRTTGQRERKRVAYREASSSEDDDEFEADSDSADEAPAPPRARARRASPSASEGDEDSDESADDGDAEAGSGSEHEAVCRVCDDGGDIILCDGCPASFHPGCLSPPLDAAPEGSWLCPSCSNPLGDIERILDVRTVQAPAAAAAATASPRPSRQELFVKFRERSYRECTWVPRAEMLAAGRRFPGILAKLRNFDAKGRERAAIASGEAGSDLEDQEDGGGMVHGVRPEWLLVERVIACHAGSSRNEATFLCKWQELGYEECTWEAESSLGDFAAEVAAFQARDAIDANAAGTAARAKRPRRRDAQPAHPFEHLSATPSCLSGSLHSYQLVGVNWLTAAHEAGHHVILADEMGLGKTVQAIGLLAMVHERARQFGTAVMPHLVVAPLSTLRNWMREFATWAPHMNVVMMIGPAAARQVIRDTEVFVAGKRSPLKFHVMLTSYEITISESALLNSIEWDVLCVDEGHRLRTKESRLFETLSGLHVSQRILLTGTPLNNRIDELFTLLQYLDPAKFPSADELQAQFDADSLDKEAKLRDLHELLKPHLLRRVKRDVLKDLPPKRELIVRVGLSPMQRELYKATLTKNLPALRALSGRSAPLPKLTNVMMDLRQICCHPYLKGAESDERLDRDLEHEQMTGASGKLVLLKRLLPALRAGGHRVLIYSQFVRMLDVLEDWLKPMNMPFERIDGGVGGAQRQVRIDRFNASGSKSFLFLLSTRAGGIGLNLQSADTVIIFDSDWNPHADAQAAARAHRMGQQKDVLVYRLVTRSSVEERIVSAAKRKVVLERLVVMKSEEDNKRSAGGLRQAELDDILRCGASELFADEGAAPAADQWDDATIEQLLDRNAAVEEADDEPEDDMLAAFKVAHFEQPAAEAAAPVAAASAPAAEPSAMEEPAPRFWESLLGDRYAADADAEAAALGKGLRSRKAVSYAHGEANVGSEEDGSDFSADPPDDDDDSDDEGGADGGRLRSLERGLRPLVLGDVVHGFEPRERATFLKAVMRFGIGDLSFRKHAAALEKKSRELMREYGVLFLTHLAEADTEDDTFSDGVPKDGIKVPDVLQRIAALELFRHKEADCRASQLLTFGSPLSSASKAWGPAQDYRLVYGLLSHGWGSWRDIELDDDLMLQAALRSELGQPAPGVERQPPPSAAAAAPAEPADGAEPAAAAEPSAADAAKELASWRASLVQGLTPAELGQQTNWIKRRFDILREAIHRETLYQSTGAQPAPRPAKAAAKPFVLPPLSNLVTPPPQADDAARAVAERYVALCAAAEAARADAHTAYCNGRGGETAGAAGYASALADIETQCLQLTQLLQNPGASAPTGGAGDAIELE